MNRNVRFLQSTRTTVRANSTNVTDASQKLQEASGPPPWRPPHVLDQWVARDARPISLRQLSFFGRKLTEARLISSANYVREELPIRIAHRLRNMQLLPYSALTNRHIRHVYELYYDAFERLRKVREVRSMEDNQTFCGVINSTLNEHLSVIPRLAMGILEIQDTVSGEKCDEFITTMLRSRISRRVIAQQHLALTETFRTTRQSSPVTSEDDFVGEIFLKCNAKELINRCANNARDLIKQAYGPDVVVPEIVLQGHLDTTFPYIPSHLEYMIGELLRNSVQATVEQCATPASPPPIEVLICETSQHVIIRVSDQGGGVDQEVLPYLWSFAKGPRRKRRLQNLEQVPKLAATTHEVKHSQDLEQNKSEDTDNVDEEKIKFAGSLDSLSGRPPDLKLGIGLPMSRLYAEYWAGSLEIHNLEGYGCDAFLQINRLGNKNEVLSTRANIDAV